MMLCRGFGRCVYEAWAVEQGGSDDKMLKNVGRSLRLETMLDGSDKELCG